jgi:hypothetical protein
MQPHISEKVSNLRVRMATPPPKETINLESIGNLIRHWVHYDNAIAAMNKQLRNLRDLKTTYESQVLHMLKSSNVKQPVIQIVGGRILVGEDKTSQPLSFTMLETMMDKYYASKPGSKPETKEILKFIREHRTMESTPCLRRIHNQKSREDKKV